MRNPLLSLVVVAGLLHPSAAAEVVHVPLHGSLQAAVAVAQPGDTLVLESGRYDDNGPLVIDKPLTLIGAGSDKTDYWVVAPGAFAVSIRHLDANDEVRIIGLRVIPKPLLGLPAAAVLVLDCAGRVSLADVKAYSFSGNPGQGLARAVVHVQDAAQVSLSGCAVICGNGSTAATPAIGTECLRAQDSSVWINACTLQGGLGIGGSVGGFGAPGGPAVRSVNSTVHVARSTLVAGPAKSGTILFFTTALAGDGTPALIAENSVVDVRGGPENVLRGSSGSIGFDHALNQADYGVGASAVLLDASSVLVTASDALLVAGLDGNGVSSASLVGGTGAWTQAEQSLGTLRVSPLSAKLGGSSSAELAGEPFGVGVVGLSTAQVPAFDAPDFLGPIVLDLGALHTLPPFGLGASGLASRTTPLPASSALSGLSVIVQGFVVSPQGAVSVSAPTAQAFVQ